MTRVLVITGDPIGPRMAGPAIRAWNMARELSIAGNDVTLVTTTILNPIEAPQGVSFTIARVTPGEDAAFAKLERWAEVIVFQGHAMAQFPVLRSTDRVIVADIYDPMHLEMLEQGRELPRATWELRVQTATAVLNEQLAAADFMLCASERQRLFYLGQLAALGRINPDVYESDPHLERLLAVAPFGIESTPPRGDRAALKGVIDGIGEGDRLLIWGGGLYSWFDPKSLIEAMASLVRRRPSARLYFLGTRHPGVDSMGIVRESYDLASTLGVLDSAVFFNDDWVHYADRQNYLVEADAGVSTHMSHIETTFSFRTRILDYLWAGLPMVVTEGDSFAELVAAEGLGIVVPAGDVAALDAALERILFDYEFIAEARANVRRVAERFHWSSTLAPLVEFVREPRRAADLGTGKRKQARARRSRPSHGLRHDLSMTMHHLRHDGLGPTWRRITRRLNRG